MGEVRLEEGLPEKGDPHPLSVLSVAKASESTWQPGAVGLRGMGRWGPRPPSLLRAKSLNPVSVGDI